MDRSHHQGRGVVVVVVVVVVVSAKDAVSAELPSDLARNVGVLSGQVRAVVVVVVVVVAAAAAAASTAAAVDVAAGVVAVAVFAVSAELSRSKTA